MHSIVGRFLEHSRIYYFYHDGNEDVYLASADMMTRNLDRRVELLFPVEQEDLHHRTMRIFEIMWADNVQARLLVCDRFTPINRRNQEPLSSQDRFIDQAARQIEKQKAARREAKENPDVFTPMQRHEETIAARITFARGQINAQEHILKVLSPAATLARGYSITRIDGHAVSSVQAVPPGSILQITLSDGTISATSRK